MCHSSHFNAFFPTQNQQNVKFLPEILIFQEPLIIETWNLCNWIWHASNPKYEQFKPFQCIFPTQNQWNVKFLAVYWTLPDKIWKKNPINLKREKCLKRFLGMLITMHYVRTLCDKYFLSYEGFSWFVTGRFRHRVLKYGAGEEWGARRTAA